MTILTSFSVWYCMQAGVMDTITFAGDDSGHEDQDEERAGGEEENKEMEKKIKNEDAAIPTTDVEKMPSEQSNMEEEEGGEEDSDNEKEMKNEESEEFSYPDTTISLSHLQPKRYQRDTSSLFTDSYMLDWLKLKLTCVCLFLGVLRTLASKGKRPLR